MATTYLRLEGAQELERKLLSLDRKVARKVTRKALRDGAKIILAEAKNRAPVGKSTKDHKAGMLKKALKVRAGKSRKDGLITVLVSTRKGDFKGDEFYGGFVHQGTEERFHKSGKSVGKVTANPYLFDAAEAKKQQAVDTIMRSMAAGIEAVARGA